MNVQKPLKKPVYSTKIIITLYIYIELLKFTHALKVLLPKGTVSVSRYKARLVAQGFSQRPGEDYNETFAPVARFGSIRTLLAYSVYRNMKIHQMDVKTAFLNDVSTRIFI